MPFDRSGIEEKFLDALKNASSSESLEELRRMYFGRKGVFNSALQEIVKLPSSERQRSGQEINTLKQKLEGALFDEISRRESAKLERELNSEKLDKSLPSYPFMLGRPHPLTQVMDEISAIFNSLGFSVEEGPEIETDENNFTSLNIPSDHPARDMHDTFYIRGNPGLLLRTHTSPVQIRVMRSRRPPFNIIVPGKVYRHEAIDATHSSVFHQLEGLSVGVSISFAGLKGTLEEFNRRFFGEKVKTRFRPSYFPFVEPGAEVDISCTICSGSGSQAQTTCPVCKGSGWIEMLGAGMVHPNVFKAVGYDPEEVTGFAFGMGIERIAMVRYGITDMRLFYENHLDFLSQF